MGNRCRGMLIAYKQGRLDNYITTRFGSFKRYMEYILRRIGHNKE